MGRLIRRIRYLFSQSRVEADLREEMEFHRAQAQQRLQRSGLSGGRGRAAALGNVTLAREDARVGSGRGRNSAGPSRGRENAQEGSGHDRDCRDDDGVGDRGECRGLRPP